MSFFSTKTPAQKGAEDGTRDAVKGVPSKRNYTKNPIGQFVDRIVPDSGYGEAYDKAFKKIQDIKKKE